MVGDTGIEPVTPSMSTKCSPAELIAHPIGRRVFSLPERVTQAPDLHDCRLSAVGVFGGRDSAFGIPERRPGNV